MAARCSYVFLGNTGLKVSNLALGTMTFGGHPDGRPTQCDEAEARRLLDAFVAVGGNFIDTADVYQAGESESILGRWLQTKEPAFRRQVIIATKARFPLGPGVGVNDVGLSRHHLLNAVEDSLERMHTSYIDLFQVRGL